MRTPRHAVCGKRGRGAIGCLLAVLVTPTRDGGLSRGTYQNVNINRGKPRRSPLARGERVERSKGNGSIKPWRGWVYRSCRDAGSDVE